MLALLSYTIAVRTVQLLENFTKSSHDESHSLLLVWLIADCLGFASVCGLSKRITRQRFGGWTSDGPDSEDPSDVCAYELLDILLRYCDPNPTAVKNARGDQHHTTSHAKIAPHRIVQEQRKYSRAVLQAQAIVRYAVTLSSFVICFSVIIASVWAANTRALWRAYGGVAHPALGCGIISGLALAIDLVVIGALFAMWRLTQDLHRCQIAKLEVRGCAWNWYFAAAQAPLCPL